MRVKIDFKYRLLQETKKKHYIMINGSIQEEDISILNMYETTIGAHQYIRIIKGEIDSNTIIVGSFNNLLSSMNRLFRQKIKKEKQSLNNILTRCA